MTSASVVGRCVRDSGSPAEERIVLAEADLIGWRREEGMNGWVNGWMGAYEAGEGVLPGGGGSGRDVGGFVRDSVRISSTSRSVCSHTVSVCVSGWSRCGPYLASRLQPSRQPCAVAPV